MRCYSNESFLLFMLIWRILTNFHRVIIHALENMGLLRMGVFSKQQLYGQILVELEENWNDCKILLGGDIDSKLSQILSNDVAKTFR